MYQVKMISVEKEPVWIVPPKISIGAANDNDIILKSEGIKAHHADLVVKDNNLFLLPGKSASNVTINGAIVSVPHPLQHSDVIGLCAIELEIIKPTNDELPAIEMPDTISDKWYIEINCGPFSGKRYTLSKTNIIGRAAECDIQVPDDNVSRKHVRLDIIGGALKVTDMGSANGCLINGSKITSAYARPGDVLTVAQHEMNIRGPFLDTDKTTVNPTGSSPITRPEKPAKMNKLPTTSTFLRREEILDSKLALEEIKNIEESKTNYIVFTGAILLTLVITSTIVLLLLK